MYSRLISRAAIVFACLMLAAACHKDPYLTLKSPDSLETASAGGPLSISFSTNRPWTLESSADWCKPSVLSGEAAEEITVKLDCAVNTDHNPRNCRVTVNTETLSFSVKVNQLEAHMVIPAQEAVSISWKDCVFTVNVQFNTPYTVTIEGGDWITYATTRSLSGTQEVFAAETNTSLSERSAIIRFEGEEIDPIVIPVVQEGYFHPILKEPQPGFYGFGYDIVYTPGRDQIGIVNKKSSRSFRVLCPSTATVAEITGIPSKLEADLSFNAGITVIRNSALKYSEDCTAKVIKLDGDLAYIIIDDEKGIITKL